MTTPANIRPRLANRKDTARYLSMSLSQFDKKIDELHKIGFPERLKHFNSYDLDAIDDFIDSMSGRNQVAYFGNSRKGGQRGKAFT